MRAFMLIVGIVFLMSGATASAQSKCDAGKLKEYGKKVFCLAKVDAKAAKAGGPVDSEKEQKCVDKFNVKCANAEVRGDCTTAVKTCAELMTEADTCRGASEGPGGTTTTMASTTLASTTTMGSTTTAPTTTTQTTSTTLPLCNGCDVCNEICPPTPCITVDSTCGWFDLAAFNACLAGFGFPTALTACSAATGCGEACVTDPFGVICTTCTACSQVIPEQCFP